LASLKIEELIIKLEILRNEAVELLGFELGCQVLDLCRRF
jgi:hypothetical protein